MPTDSWMKTARDGLYAVGDIRQDSAAQAITSAGDGRRAAIAAHRYIKRDLCLGFSPITIETGGRNGEI